jgi:3',5'-cyclic AMP phosphodiesterase CpdA
MTVLLHLSDTHFGTEQEAVVVAARKLAHAEQPDAVILSGDITQRARAAQFDAARIFCDGLQVERLLTLPGNHDIPLYNVAARLFAPYAGYARVFGRNLEPELEFADVLVIGVNTTRPERHKDGEVSPQQIERVARRLQGARRDQLRVVVTHQPVCVMRPEDEKDRLHGADAAVRAWSQAGADLVLGGHIHLPYVIDLAARPKPTPRRMWCVQAGTAVSNRVRHDTSNSVNVIEWPQAGGARACGYERWDYDAQANAFAVKERRQLDLA